MKAVFLDRDGTLIWEPPESKQVDSLSKLRILTGVPEGLRQLKKQGYVLVMVSNQNGVGTPLFPADAFDIPQKELLDKLQGEGISFAATFICPHFPEDGCDCRKPRTGLVDLFLKANSIDLSSSLVIGDRETDEEFAKNIGVRFVRMETNGRFPRFASFQRQTKETKISVFLNIDGSGQADISTGIGFLDHMLDLLAKNSLTDLTLKARGDINVDEHHTVEDTALALGSALSEALGDKRGIERYGSTPLTTSGFLLPMDEALAEVALDLSGRPFFVFEGTFKREYVGEFPTELIAHFFQSFAQALKCSLHMTIRRGVSEHHKVEALFKCLGRSLRQAFRICPYERYIPSAKGSL